MKSLKLLPLLLVVCVKVSLAQTNPDNPPLYVTISSHGDTLQAHKVLMDPHEITGITVLKTPVATKRYGLDGENGVVELKLNSRSKVYDLNALKKAYKIAQYKTIHIIVDGIALTDNYILATKRDIKEIKTDILKKDEAVDLIITTNYPEPHPTPGSNKIRIRG